MTSFISLCAD